MREATGALIYGDFGNVAWSPSARLAVSSIPRARLTTTRARDTIASISEAGAFLLQHWPPRRRRRASYRMAVTACVRALAGRIEPEVARRRFWPRSKIFRAPASKRRG